MEPVELVVMVAVGVAVAVTTKLIGQGLGLIFRTAGNVVRIQEAKSKL